MYYYVPLFKILKMYLKISIEDGRHRVIIKKSSATIALVFRWFSERDIIFRTSSNDHGLDKKGALGAKNHPYGDNFSVLD